MPPARLARTAFFPSMPAPAPIVLSFGICLYLQRHFPNFSLFYHAAVFTAQVPAVFAGLIVRHGKCVKIISSLKTAARRTYLHQTTVSFNIIVRRFMIQLILHILFLLCLRTAGKTLSAEHSLFLLCSPKVLRNMYMERRLCASLSALLQLRADCMLLYACTGFYPRHIISASSPLSS